MEVNVYEDGRMQAVQVKLRGAVVLTPRLEAGITPEKTAFSFHEILPTYIGLIRSHERRIPELTNMKSE